MNASLRDILTGLTICALLVTTSTEPALASRPRPADSLPTRSDIAWIGIAIAAVGAALGVGIYLAVRPHGHSITGCAGSGSDGLQLMSESDLQTYVLAGEVAGIKSGDRIRISGKKEAKNAGAPRRFLVEKLNKDYGSCPATYAAPKVSPPPTRRQIAREPAKNTPSSEEAEQKGYIPAAITMRTEALRRNSCFR